MSSTSALATSAKSIAKVTATIVGNAGALFSTSLPHAPTATKAAPASILDPSHPDPVNFDPTDPIVLFIVQAALIVGISRLLQFGLKRLRQPRVISEIIGGIILGPSAFGRIPHFTAHIFPPLSLPYLNLVSTIGLVLFLFLVGLEVDFSVFRRGVKASASISIVGIVVPFAIGAAISVGLYDKYIDASTVKFGTFLLFIGTAYGITAFPVLARILTELNLLQDPLGVTVLAAGVGNDVVGWILLALSVALVNAASGIIVLYVILCAIGWILALWFIARPLLVFACRKTGAYGDKGPSQSIICAIVFLVLTSAWVTDRIGIHAIFGGFVVGLIIPTPIRAALTEKIEDLVSVLFLPIYFALSGLKTDLGLLNSGGIWGYTVLVVLCAFLSKFLSCGIVAKLNGMNWRESGAVGSLMACKGLVELIVLNIGLSAGILNNQVFAQFVFMALVTTFVTTPLTILFYPVAYRQRLAHDKVGCATISSAGPSAGPGSLNPAFRYAVVLQQFEHLPAVFAFCKLIKAPVRFADAPHSPSSSDEKSEEHLSPLPPVESPVPASALTVSALRLVELSERTSAIISASDPLDKLVASDSLSQAFRAFAHGSGIPATASISIVGSDQFPDAVATHVEEFSSDLVVLPWALHGPKAEPGVVAKFLPNPFEGIFRGAGGDEGAPQYASFARRVFAEASCQVGLFFDRGVDAVFEGKTHLFFAFHGGSDDRACLDLIVQFASRNPCVTATVVRIIQAPEPDLTEKETRQSTGIDDDETPIVFSQLTVHEGHGAVDTVYQTQNEITSNTADDLALALWFEPSLTPRPAEVVDGLARIDFSTLSTARPLHSSVLCAKEAHLNVPVVVVAGRGRKDAKSHQRELGAFLKENLDAVQHSIANSSEVRRSMGDLAVAYLVAGCGTSLFVVQSARPAGAGKSKAV